MNVNKESERITDHASILSDPNERLDILHESQYNSFWPGGCTKYGRVGMCC